jgi:hypothetical protein
VLPTDPDTPPMTKTTMSTDLLHPLDIITQLSIKVLGKYLLVLSGLEILLPVKKPKGNLELTRVLNNSNKLFNFISSKFSGSLGYVYLSLFADEIGKTASKTLNFGKGKYDVTLSLNVSIENTKNVLKFGSLH